MWKKTILLMSWLIVLSASVLGVSLGTNLSIQAVCTDISGNVCMTDAYWTVISPNGTTYANNTQGGLVNGGIRNYTVWFNSTGVWLVFANFSGQNITHEYAVVVEDYGIEGLQEDFNMSGVYIFFAIIVLAFLYAGFSF